MVFSELFWGFDSHWEQLQRFHLTLVNFEYHSALYLAHNKWICFITAIEIDPSAMWLLSPWPPFQPIGPFILNLDQNLWGRMEKSIIDSYPSDVDSNLLSLLFWGNCACSCFVGRMYFLMTNSTLSFRPRREYKNN